MQDRDYSQKHITKGVLEPMRVRSLHATNTIEQLEKKKTKNEA